MTDRPIIFSAPMVNALIEGRKTMTRRVIEPCKDKEIRAGDILVSWPADAFVRKGERFRPKHLKGDRLWVKEAWRAFLPYDKVKPSGIWHPGCGHGVGIMYEADLRGLAIAKMGDRSDCFDEDPNAFGKLRSPMFMPRWASRITLIIENVDIQRVQDITPDNAAAEGIMYASGSYEMEWFTPAERERKRVSDFRDLWNSINGKKPNCGWEDNPWCAVYKFRTVLANIDTLAEVVDAEAA